MATEFEDELRAYLEALQAIELYINDSSPLRKIIAKHAIRPEFYATEAGKQELIDELKDYMVYLTQKSGSTGKLMSSNALKKFLEKSERQASSASQIRAVDQLSERNVQRRIELFTEQITKEAAYLKAQVKEFMINAEISGRTSRDVLTDLIRAAKDDAGIVEGFKKKIDRVAIDAARREAQQQAMDNYLKVAKAGEHWMWITVSSKPCPDCQARAGKILPLERWRAIGIPGEGRTICLFSCKCQLGPVSVFEEMFPDAKEYHWDKDKLVLTTMREARTLRTAKSASDLSN